MRNNLHLNILYKFVDTQDSNGNNVSYYEILNFFSEVGVVTTATLKKVYDNYRPSGPVDKDCLFSSLDQMGHFAIDICKEVSAPEVFLLSVQDYNIGLDSCNDIRSFKEIFRRYGTSIENPEGGHKKKNIFGKFFS
jgi:hypothetical protein